MTLIKPSGFGQETFKSVETIYIYIWPDRVQFFDNDPTIIYGKWKHSSDEELILQNDSITIIVRNDQILQKQPGYLEFFFAGRFEMK